MSEIDEILWKLNGGWKRFIMDILCLIIKYTVIGSLVHFGWNLLK